jgi:DNA modification methylase
MRCAVADNVLFYGDNLDVLRSRIPSESVDLVYLDPPFNSNRAYNVLFGKGSRGDAQAQIEAFDDTWTWSHETEETFGSLQSGGVPNRVADALAGMRRIVGENDVLAYLVMMSPRLVELHRVLKLTGTLYLHCDPTTSHYLKVLLDTVFGPTRFLSEVVWKRSSAHSSSKRWSPVHDVLLVYAKSDNHAWNPIHSPLPQETVDARYNNVELDTGRRFNRADLTAAGVRAGPSGAPWRGVNPTEKGRHWAIPRFVADIVGDLGTQEALDALDAAGRIFWPKAEGGIPMLKRYLDEAKGVPPLDVVTDISPLNNATAERLGYPTQKPQALLERIIRVSSNPNEVVLDPFCGCGTTIAAAHALGRRWIGIDITYIAVDLIQKRLVAQYGDQIRGSFVIDGIPRDLRGARALFSKSPLDFQRWAVSLVEGTPNERTTGDRGVDGVVRFIGDRQGQISRALVSVKGGSVHPSDVRDLIGTIDTQRAEMGILVTLERPTRGIVDAVHHSGSYVWSVTGRAYPRIQVMTIEQLLDGVRPDMPTPLLPYIKAQRTQLDRQLALI